MSVITMLPDRHNIGTAYGVLLYRALERVGLRYVQIPFSLRYLLRHGPQERYHYLHFHWPEVFFVIRPHQPHKLFGLKGYLHLHAFWLLAKWRGYRLAWTVHEVDVHDLQHQVRFHTVSRRLLWRLADIVFVHSPQVRDRAEQRWSKRPHVYTIPHGSYQGAYPEMLPRRAARQRLGIPDAAFTFVFFGNIRPYKGVDILLDAFRALHTDHPEAHLIVAGNPHSPEMARDVERACASLPHVHLALAHIPDEDVQIYLRAADCLVAPHRYIETCGVIYLAMAFELPVIIKSEGNAAEFESYAIGIFMRDATETESAMRRILEMPASAREALRANARATSRAFSWDTLQEHYRDAFAALESAAR